MPVFACNQVAHTVRGCPALGLQVPLFAVGRVDRVSLPREATNTRHLFSLSSLAVGQQQHTQYTNTSVTFKHKAL
jgi:hypothetical protein